MEGLIGIFSIVAGGIITLVVTQALFSLFEKLCPKFLLDLFGKIWEAFYILVIILVIILCLWSCIGNEQSPSHRDEFDERQGPFYRGDEF